MAFLIGGANSAADDAYSVSNSAIFDGVSNQECYLTRDNTSQGGAGENFTFSAWLKRTTFGSGNYQGILSIFKDDNDFFEIYFDNGDGTGAGGEFLQIQQQISGTGVYYQNQTYKYADYSAWFHLVVSFDNSQSGEINKIKVYVNGTEVSTGEAVSSANPFDDVGLGSTDYDTRLGTYRDNTSYTWDGYMAEVCLIAGSTLDADSFGKTDSASGIWVPKDVSGLTFGTNGWYMEFKQSGTGTDSSGIGADTSGNDNHLAVTGFAANDQKTDTPTNNFAVMNPLQSVDNSEFSKGNLKINMDTNDDTAFSSIAPSEGKWYWEEKRTTQGGRGYTGICDFAIPEMGGNAGRDASDEWAIMIDHNGNTEEGGANTTVNSHVKGSAPSDGDIFTYAVDLDNGQVWVGVNANVDITGTANVTGFVTGIPYFYFFEDSGSGTTTIEINFGNPSFSISSGNADADGYGNFEYAVPSGYYALCTKNLAEYG